MASSLVEMGAADGEVNLDAFAFDIERVVRRLGSMEAEVDTTAVIDEQTGRVSYGTSVNVDQEVDEIFLPCCMDAYFLDSFWFFLMFYVYMYFSFCASPTLSLEK